MLPIIIARATQPDLLARAVATHRPQLITIPYSNYCELARWSLDAAYGGRDGGVESNDNHHYDEMAYPPGAHVLPTLAMRVGKNGGRDHISSSSSMMSSPGGGGGTEGGGERGGGSPTGVPVCAMPDGTILVDSWSILEACAFDAGWSANGLTSDLRDLLDAKMGAHARTMAYRGLLKCANRNVCDMLLTFDGGWMWRMAWACIGGKFVNSLGRGMRLEDDVHMSRVEDELNAGLDLLGKQLASLPTPYWGGDRPGVVDVAISALLAPCVLPDGYCGGRYNDVWNTLLNQDEEVRMRVSAYRNTEIGRHILRVYAACGRGSDATPIIATG